MIRRWINEYLDGEIGLADKAELERLMAQHPEIREEYKELRRIGLLLGSMPQVRVHQTRFRERMSEALDQRERTYFTPQRIFATAMTVVLLVVGLTFSMVMYQLKLAGLNDAPGLTTPAVMQVPAVRDEYRITLPVGTSAEIFFDRLLLETQLKMVDNGLLGTVLNQTTIYEGATCLDNGGLRQTRFAGEIPQHQELTLSAQQVAQLAKFAQGISGQTVRPEVRTLDGQPLNYQDYLERLPGGSNLTVILVFK